MTDRPREGAASAPKTRARRGIRLSDSIDHTAAPSPSNETRLPIAFLDNARAPVARLERLSWDELTALLTTPQPGPKEGPSWMPAEIDPGRRTAERVRSWSVLALDIEAASERDPETGAKRAVGPQPPPLAELLEEIAAYGWRAVGATSYSHTQAAPRYRLTFALSRPLAPAEIRPLGEHVARVLGIAEACDLKCLEPARLLFLPRCAPESLALFEHGRCEGEPLPVDAMLTHALREQAAAQAAPAPRRPPPSEGARVISAYNAAHSVGELLERHGYEARARNRWIFPGSTTGVPGVRLLSNGKIYSDHGQDPLADGHPHDAFDLFRLLEHGGDQRAAVRAAAEELGLSSRKRHDAAPPAPPAPPPADGDDPPPLPPASLRVGPYLWEQGELYLIRVSVGRGENASATETKVLLANFSAIVTEERLRDDGDAVDNATLLRVFQPRNGRMIETEIELPTDRFAPMGWVTGKLGHHYLVSAGNSVRDHLRAAIQTFSGRYGVQTRRVYTHTGWREIDGALTFLHAGGGITAQGAREDLSVDLPDSRYRLPAPPAPPELRAAVRASLRQLDLTPDHLGIAAMQMARVAAPPLGRWLRLDWGAFVVGRTGTLKTELAALAMAHYGDFHARALPGSWESSEGALLLQAHAAQNSLFEVDDFAPSGAAHDHAQLAKRADRVFRGASNAAGRERLTSDIRLRKGQYPRGLVSASGEDLPPGRSLRARLWITELDVGAVDLGVLSECQREAAQGRYREAMAAYLQWLAAHDAELAARLPGEYERLRVEAPEALRVHGRIPANLAGLKIAVDTWLRFAVDAGALDSEASFEIHRKLCGALDDAAKLQAGIQEQTEDATRFVEMLRAALASGRAHLADAGKWPTSHPPALHAALCGWRGHQRRADDPEDSPRYEPQGELIGFVESARGEAWLIPDAAFSTVSRIARDQNAGALRSQSRLGRALVEKGYLRPGEGRNVGYRHGRRGITPARVWCMPLAKLTEDGE